MDKEEAQIANCEMIGLNNKTIASEMIITTVGNWIADVTYTEQEEKQNDN